jgi:hypothetical protein
LPVKALKSEYNTGQIFMIVDPGIKNNDINMDNKSLILDENYNPVSEINFNFTRNIF